MANKYLEKIAASYVVDHPYYSDGPKINLTADEFAGYSKAKEDAFDSRLIKRPALLGAAVGAGISLASGKSGLLNVLKPIAIGAGLGGFLGGGVAVIKSENAGNKYLQQLTII